MALLTGIWVVDSLGYFTYSCDGRSVDLLFGVTTHFSGRYTCSSIYALIHEDLKRLVLKAFGFVSAVKTLIINPTNCFPSFSNSRSCSDNFLPEKHWGGDICLQGNSVKTGTIAQGARLVSCSQPGNVTTAYLRKHWQICTRNLKGRYGRASWEPLSVVQSLFPGLRTAPHFRPTLHQL